MRDVYETRKLFEVKAVELAAEHWTRDDLAEVRAILDEIWARNPDGARAAMHRLMDLTERNISSALTRRKNESVTQSA